MQYRAGLVATGLLRLALVSAQSNTPNLTSLVASTSQLAGLATLFETFPVIGSAFTNLTNVTFFAPNNAAIKALEASGALSKNVNPAFVLDGLQYHVALGEIYASDISSTPTFAHTILNNTLLTNVTGGQVVEAAATGSTVTITSGLKLEAQVVEANLNFTGGVVHVIDSVLTVPTALITTAELADLTAFAGALVAAGLLPTLEVASDLTIFAPTNAAFAAISSAVGGLSKEEAASILEYHVINGTVAYSSSLGTGSIATAAGTKVDIAVEDGAIFVNSARVIIADILFSGGVIHVIDAVLNPNNVTKPDPSVTTPVVEYASATSGSMVPYTSAVSFSPSRTIPALTATTDDVAKGYTTAAGGGAVGTHGGSASGSGSGSSSSSGMAGMPTVAVGAAALIGGAALLAL